MSAYFRVPTCKSANDDGSAANDVTHIGVPYIRDDNLSTVFIGDDSDAAAVEISFRTAAAFDVSSRGTV